MGCLDTCDVLDIGVFKPEDLLRMPIPGLRTYCARRRRSYLLYLPSLGYLCCCVTRDLVTTSPLWRGLTHMNWSIILFMTTRNLLVWHEAGIDRVQAYPVVCWRLWWVLVLLGMPAPSKLSAPSRRWETPILYMIGIEIFWLCRKRFKRCQDLEESWRNQYSISSHWGIEE